MRCHGEEEYSLESKDSWNVHPKLAGHCFRYTKKAWSQACCHHHSTPGCQGGEQGKGKKPEVFSEPLQKAQYVALRLCKGSVQKPDNRSTFHSLIAVIKFTFSCLSPGYDGQGSSCFAPSEQLPAQAPAPAPLTSLADELNVQNLPSAAAIGSRLSFTISAASLDLGSYLDRLVVAMSCPGASNASAALYNLSSFLQVAVTPNFSEQQKCTAKCASFSFQRKS